MDSTLAAARFRLSIVALPVCSLLAMGGRTHAQDGAISPGRLNARFVPAVGDAVRIHDRVSAHYSVASSAEGAGSSAEELSTEQDVLCTQRFTEMAGDKPIRFVRRFSSAAYSEGREPMREFMVAEKVHFEIAEGGGLAHRWDAGGSTVPDFLKEQISSENRAGDHALEGILPPPIPVAVEHDLRPGDVWAYSVEDAFPPHLRANEPIYEASEVEGRLVSLRQGGQAIVETTYDLSLGRLKALEPHIYAAGPVSYKIVDRIYFTLDGVLPCELLRRVSYSGRGATSSGASVTFEVRVERRVSVRSGIWEPVRLGRRPADTGTGTATVALVDLAHVFDNSAARKLAEARLNDLRRVSAEEVTTAMEDLSARRRLLEDLPEGSVDWQRIADGIEVGLRRLQRWEASRAEALRTLGAKRWSEVQSLVASALPQFARERGIDTVLLRNAHESVLGELPGAESVVVLWVGSRDASDDATDAVLEFLDSRTRDQKR